jgi:hypothetical protein
MAFFSGWILLAWGAAPAVLIIDRLEGKIKILMVRIVLYYFDQVFSDA